jgi:tRNA (guanine-N7-)-methyltransferase
VGEDRSRGRPEVGAVLSTGTRPQNGEPDKSGSFFGRRKGKQLRPGQARVIEELLPQLRVPRAPDGLSDLGRLFPVRPRSITLEIGFGGGEHLAFRARSNPETGFIGCEPFVNGMAKLLSVVAEEALGNVRVWDEDATELLAALPEAAIDCAYLLYPDPWPKRRQRKRRFLSDDNLAALARILRPRGELRFATDIDDYAGWGLARVFRSADFEWQAQRADDWRQPWAGWPSTRYEAKARREGRGTAYLTFTRL